MTLIKQGLGNFSNIEEISLESHNTVTKRTKKRNIPINNPCLRGGIGLRTAAARAGASRPPRKESRALRARTIGIWSKGRLLIRQITIGIWSKGRHFGSWHAPKSQTVSIFWFKKVPKIDQMLL